jgi:hypothetical protein
MHGSTCLLIGKWNSPHCPQALLRGTPQCVSHFPTSANMTLFGAALHTFPCSPVFLRALYLYNVLQVQQDLLAAYLVYTCTLRMEAELSAVKIGKVIPDYTA